MRRSVSVLLVVTFLSSLLGLGLTTITATPAAAAPGDPFNSAAAQVYIAQGLPTTRLYAASTDGSGTTTFTPVGPAANFAYNSVAYNNADNYIYGVAFTAGTASNGAAIPANSLIRIGQDGYITRVGSLTYSSGTASGGGFNVGAFGADGNLHVMEGNTGSAIRVINPTTGALVRSITLTSPGVSDFVFKDGFFWGIRNATGNMVRINATNGAVTVFNPLVPPAIGYGAVWTYGNGNLGVSNNETGTIYQIQITNPASASPTFTIVSSNDGPPNGNNDGTSSAGIPTDLQVVKNGSATFSPGDQISYTLTVTNNGAGVSSGFVVSDSVPASLTNVSSTDAGCTVSGNDVTCVSGTMAVGASQSFTITATTPTAAGGCITNTATVLANEADSAGSNNTSSVTSCPTDNPTITCASDPNLFNTAYNAATGGKLAVGTTDPRWDVSNQIVVPDNTLYPVQMPSASTTWSPGNVVGQVTGPSPTDPVGGDGGHWAQSPFGNADWISRETTSSQASGFGVWYYRYQFYLDPAVDPAQFALKMDFLADNSVMGVFINGVNQGYQQTANAPTTTSSGPATGPFFYRGYNQVNAAQTTLDQSWQTGLNTITIQLDSYITEGFLAQVQPQALCPSITVEKEVDGRIQSGDQFTVAVEESDGTVLTSATTSGTETSVTSDPAYVAQGTAYTITDSLATGSALGNYDKTAVCTGAITGTMVTLTGSGPEWTFTPTAFDDYTCTVTNTAKAVGLELLKEAGTPVDVNGNGITDTGDTIAYTFTVTNTGDVTMDSIAVDDPMVGSVACPQTTLDPDDSTTCTADLYTVTAADVTAGTIVNNATASGTPPGSTTPVTSDPSTTTTPTTEPDPGLSIVKSADPATAAAYTVGQVISYSFVVTNTGNVPMEDVTVEETAFSGSGSMSAVACPATTVAVGGQMTCTASYTLTQADIDSGSLTNAATATGTPPGSNTPVDSPPDTVTIPQDAAPALTVEKSSDPSTVTAAGEVVTYSFLVTNTGNVTINDVAVAEQSFSGSGAMSAVTCPDTALIPGESTTCSATYTATQADIDGDEITNTATVTGTPPSGPEVESPPDTTTVTTPDEPELSVVKSVDPTAASAAGEVITYSFVVTNTGNVTIQDVAIDEGAFSGTGTMSAITCPLAAESLAPGAEVTCTATYTLTQADVNSGSVTNTATATGTPPSGTPVDSPQSSAAVTAGAAPVLTMDKTSDPSAVATAGQTITYSFVVTNDGNVTINNVAIDEDAFSGTGQLSTITCPNDNDLDPDESMTCTATYEVTQEDIDAGPLSNTATATGTPPSGPAVESPPSTSTVATPDDPSLEVVKSANPTSAGAVGQTITYSFLVTNNGNVTMSSIAIDEGAFTGTGTMSAITCPDTTLAPAASATCTATYTLTQADVNSGSVTNTATGTGTPPSGPPVDSPPSTSTVTVSAAPALTVDKSAVPGTVGKAGDVVTYRFLVTNTGNVTISDIVVDETAFSGTGQLSATTCPATSLAASAQMTCTATYSVTQADVDRGDLTNTATVTGTPPTGPEVESPPDTTTVSTPDVPGLSIVKSASPTDASSFTAGAVITYSFVVTNTGNVTMTGVGVGEQSFTGSGSLSAITCPPAAASVAPGGQVTCTATYTVTQADVDAGGITNVAAGTGTPPSGTPVKSPPDEVRIPEPAAPSLTVVKSSDTDRLTDVGQEITYSFLVTNTGNVTVSDVVVDEGAFNGSGELSPVTCPAAAGSLAPGEQATCTATYTVVQADLDRDSITNTATATGTPPSGPSVESAAGTVEVPSTGRGRLVLTKQADAVDVDGNGTIEAGDRIEWTIKVTNPGTATVRDITVSDPTAGNVTCPRSTLRPGQSMTCTVRAHAVTAADVAAGRVRNTAVASGVETEGVSKVISDDGSAIATLGDEGSSPLPDTGASGGMRAAGLAGGLALLAGALLLIGARRRRSLES